MSTPSLIDVLDTAYRLDLSDEEWLKALTSAARPYLGGDLGVIGYIFDSEQSPLIHPDEIAFDGPSHGALFSVEGVRASMQSPTVALLKKTHCAMLSDSVNASPAARDFYWAHLAPADALGVVGSNPTGRGICLSSIFGARQSPSVSRRECLVRVATHLAAALRLRDALASVAADPLNDAEVILGVDGRTLHLGDTPHNGRLEALHSSVLAIEKARGPLRSRDTFQALELWQGLVDGQWSIIDVVDHDGKRFYVAHANTHTLPAPRGLSPSERGVLAYVALGHSDKFIAYELGITRSTVSNHVVSIRRKLGLRTRVEIIRLAQAFGPSADAPPSNVASWLHQFEFCGESLAALTTNSNPGVLSMLSNTEREITAYILEGLSNAQIATRRGTSVRTVANQVARIFEKRGVRCRAELAAMDRSKSSHSLAGLGYEP